MKLEYGRPCDFASRLDKEKRTYEFLDALGIEYARVRIIPRFDSLSLPLLF